VDVGWIKSAPLAALFAGIGSVSSYQEQEAIEYQLERSGLDVLPEARKALSQPAWRARESALVLLAALPDVASLPWIASRLTDPSERVRLLARRALHHVLRRTGAVARSDAETADLIRGGLSWILNDLFVTRCESKSGHGGDACRILKSTEVEFLPFNRPPFASYEIALHAPSRKDRRMRIAALNAPPEVQERCRGSTLPRVLVQPVRVAGGYARVAFSFEQLPFNAGSAWSVAMERKGERWVPIDALAIHRLRASGYQDPERHFSNLEVGRLELLDLAMERKRLRPPDAPREMEARRALGLEPDDRLDSRYSAYLREYLKDASEAVRMTAAWGLLELGDAQGAAFVADACRGADRQSPRGRWCMQHNPSMRQPALSREELLGMMRESRKVRGCPVGDRWFGLERVQHAPDTLAHLRSIALAEAEEDLRRKALAVLRFQRDPELLPFWRKILAEKVDPSASGAALLGLASIGNPEALALLEEHIGERDPRRVPTIDLFRLLGSSREGAASALLLSLAQNPEPSIRSEALRALRMRAERKTVSLDVILAALRDSDPRVVEAALVLADRREARDEALLLPIVAGLLKRPDHSLRRQAELWLRGTCSRESVGDRWEGLEALAERGEIDFSKAPFLAACFAGRYAWIGDMDRALQAARAALVAIQAESQGNAPRIDDWNRGAEPHLRALVAVLQIRNGEDPAAGKTLDLLESLPGAEFIPSRDPSHIEDVSIVGKRTEVVSRLRRMISEPLRLRVEPRTVKAQAGEKVRLEVVLDNRSDSTIHCEVGFDDAGKPRNLAGSVLGVNIYGVHEQEHRIKEKREVMLSPGESIRFERRVWVGPRPLQGGFTAYAEPRCRYDDVARTELKVRLVSPRGRLTVQSR
jgi:HEAT repeat protein